MLSNNSISVPYQTLYEMSNFNQHKLRLKSPTHLSYLLQSLDSWTRTADHLHGGVVCEFSRVSHTPHCSLEYFRNRNATSRCRADAVEAIPPSSPNWMAMLLMMMMVNDDD